MGQAQTNTRKLNRDISTGTAVFLNRKRVNVCEHTTKTPSKYLDSVSVCLCVPVPFVISSVPGKEFSLSFPLICDLYIYRPRGKESTEVRKSQIKGKESENSYQELKRSRKGKTHTNTRKLI